MVYLSNMETEKLGYDLSDCIFFVHCRRPIGFQRVTYFANQLREVIELVEPHTQKIINVSIVGI